MAVLSTRMKRSGCEDMEGRVRVSCRRLTEEEVSAALGGMKVPSPRKDFTLDMRRREDAEGERRMMGSRRRAGFFCSEDTRGAEGAGVGPVGLLRVRNVLWAILR